MYSTSSDLAALGHLPQGGRLWEGGDLFRLGFADPPSPEGEGCTAPGTIPIPYSLFPTPYSLGSPIAYCLSSSFSPAMAKHSK